MTKLEKLVGKKKATKLAKEHLHLNDYIVLPPAVAGGFEWETVSQFVDRVRICWMTMKRKLADSDCPAFEKQCGPTGRILKLRSNAAFDRHMERKAFRK